MDTQLENALTKSCYKEDLLHIRESLWKNTTAVLVGSGFSLNANPEMPSWDSWAKILANKMDITDKEQIKAQDVPWLAGAYAKRYTPKVMHDLLIGPIRKYKAVAPHVHEQLVELPWTDIFTTNYDTFLEEAAHKIQISGNLDRDYKVISSVAGLPLSRSQRSFRILKLHGCINVDASWIITEEEYRTYRDKYAPFVNTVRQTILENELCLIGYSATDPDFLEWIGWVRDRLFGNHLNIYWFTKDKLTKDEEYIYSQRGVTCISLDCFDYPLTPPSSNEVSGAGAVSPKNHIASYTEEGLKDLGFSVGHYRTFSNFLRWLKQGNPNFVSPHSHSTLALNPTDKINTGGKSTTSGTNPPLPHSPPENALAPLDEIRTNTSRGQTEIPDNYSEALTSTSKEQTETFDTHSMVWSYPDLKKFLLHPNNNWNNVLELIPSMVKARREYPGWIIPPMKILRNLWDMHRVATPFILTIQSAPADVSDLERLKPLREICWLLDIAAIPIMENLDQFLHKILCSTYPSLRKTRNQPTDALPVAEWMCIATLLLRWYRVECKYEAFQEIEKKLSNLVRRFPDSAISSALKYQQILLQLERFDRSKALNLVVRWNVSNAPGIYTIYKSMLLGELGSIKQGYLLLKQLYDKILPECSEKSYSLERLSIARLAAECLRQLSLIAENQWFPLTAKEEKKEYEGIPTEFIHTLPTLSKQESDVVGTLSKLQDDLKAATANAQIVPSKIKFETGTRDSSRQLHSGFKPGMREAFQCDCFMEKLGRTPYLGFASFDISTWLETAQLFFYLHKGLNNHSLRILLRSAPGNTFKAGQDIFLQYNLAMLPEDSAYRLIEQLRHGLQMLVGKKTPYGLDERFSKFGLELLSRLSARAKSEEHQQKLLSLAFNWSKQGPNWARYNALSELNLFCRRVIEYSPYKLLSDHLDECLSSPVLMGFSSLKKAHHHLFFSRSKEISTALPFVFPGLESKTKLQKVGKALWEELIQHELSVKNTISDQAQVQEIKDNLLGRYYVRLLWMLKHDLLEQSVRNEMAQYVWNDYQISGLPKLPGVRDWAILDWPTPNNIKVTERYKEELLTLSIAPASYTNSDGHRTYPGNYTAPLYEYLAISQTHRNTLDLTHKEKLKILNNCHTSEFQEDNIAKSMYTYARNPLNKLTWILTYIFGADLISFKDDAPWLSNWLAELLTYAKNINANCMRLEVLRTAFDSASTDTKELSLTLEENLHDTDSDVQIEAGFAILFWHFQIKNCPSELYNAILRAFWLMPPQQAIPLAEILTEQFDNYPQTQPINDIELRILNRALNSKLLAFDYKKSKKELLSNEELHVNDWVKKKEFQELLPEYRQTLGMLVKSLLLSTSDMCNSSTRKSWIKLMKEDPLAEMRKLGEELEILLKQPKK